MKEETIIKVSSSSGDPYDVHFQFSENKFTVFCNCQAGIYGKLCKHKTGLLNGDSSILFDNADHEILEQIHQEVKKSKYTEIIASYNSLRKEIETAQRKEKILKGEIEQALKTGIDTVRK